MDSHRLMLKSNNVSSTLQVLSIGREVLVPINCSCSGKFFQASFSYQIQETTTSIPEIACGVFEGLVKSQTVFNENQFEFQVGSKLDLPLKCACSDRFSTSEMKYLVTYPFVLGDSLDILSEKFGILTQDLLAVNHLEPKATVYPNTTILVPLNSEPFINFSVSDSQPPGPGFLPTKTVDRIRSAKLRIMYFVGSVIGFCLLLLALVVFGIYVKRMRIWRGERLQSFTTQDSPSLISYSPTMCSPQWGKPKQSSTSSCLSPDLLIGIKYSLINYSTEDLKRATKVFHDDNKIGDQLYKGLIREVEVMIKEIKFEESKRVIDMYSKINHINIVTLHGVCYGESEHSSSYLVFEFPANGCLRDFLSSQSCNLHWRRRIQIAFDIATGLHYLHFCIFPSTGHVTITSKNIFVTSNLRAKLANIKASKANDPIQPIQSLNTSEHTFRSTVISEKANIFAFGVVLLELISGREDMDKKLLIDSIGFLGGKEGGGGCIEQLKNFMDPCLKGNYPLADALCLAILAKTSLEDNPLHRPSIDDIIKVLSRMVDHN